MEQDNPEIAQPASRRRSILPCSYDELSDDEKEMRQDGYQNASTGADQNNKPSDFFAGCVFSFDDDPEWKDCEVEEMTFNINYHKGSVTAAIGPDEVPEFTITRKDPQPSLGSGDASRRVSANWVNFCLLEHELVDPIAFHAAETPLYPAPQAQYPKIVQELAPDSQRAGWRLLKLMREHDWDERSSLQKFFEDHGVVPDDQDFIKAHADWFVTHHKPYAKACRRSRKSDGSEVIENQPAAKRTRLRRSGSDGSAAVPASNALQVLPDPVSTTSISGALRGRSEAAEDALKEVDQNSTQSSKSDKVSVLKKKLEEERKRCKALLETNLQLEQERDEWKKSAAVPAKTTALEARILAKDATLAALQLSLDAEQKATVAMEEELESARVSAATAMAERDAAEEKRAALEAKLKDQEDLLMLELEKIEVLEEKDSARALAENRVTDLEAKLKVTQESWDREKEVRLALMLGVGSALKAAADKVAAV